MGFAVVSIVAFAVDWTVYKLRGSPHSTVAVSRFMIGSAQRAKDGVRLPGNRECLLRGGAVSAGGQDPCWHLKRHPNQWENVGTPQY